MHTKFWLESLKGLWVFRHETKTKIPLLQDQPSAESEMMPLT
jgi:hypothetical protein